nr:sigma factor-like helix-turn-helix DNA-binding protein [Micromonospora sp. DSM 115978]
PRYRQVVTCRYFLELSEAETAELLGWPRGSVKSRLSRALARLRADLADPDLADDPPIADSPRNNGSQRSDAHVVEKEARRG